MAADLLLISDLHWRPPEGPGPQAPGGGIPIPELVVRAVRDALRDGRPDVIVLLGDMVEGCSAPGASRALEHLRSTLAAFDIPILAVPGNHDGAAALTEQAFGCRPGIHRVAGCAFAIFADDFDAAGNCSRPSEAMRLLEQAPPGEPLVVLQHAPVLPPVTSDYPYNIRAAETLAAEYSRRNVVLSLSGHYHPGLPPHLERGATYFTCPALGEPPYHYARARLEGSRLTRIDTCALGLQGQSHLFDAHVHTEFAYCATDTSVDGALQRMRALGMGCPAFAEHADQLYFPREGFWERLDADDMDAIHRAADAGHSRHATFRARMKPLREAGVPLGMECEPALSGRGLAILDEDLSDCDYVIGSVHHLAHDDDAAMPQSEACSRFMQRTEQLLASGVDILGHPFRYFPRYDRPVPIELFRPVASMLTAAGTAAEMNFHGNRPAPEFFSLCLELGVRLSIGSDAHSLVEVGELRPHLELLRMLGVSDRLDRVLWQPSMAKRRRS